MTLRLDLLAVPRFERREHWGESLRGPREPAPRQGIERPDHSRRTLVERGKGRGRLLALRIQRMRGPEAVGGESRLAIARDRLDRAPGEGFVPAWRRQAFVAIGFEYLHQPLIPPAVNPTTTPFVVEPRSAVRPSTGSGRTAVSTRCARLRQAGVDDQIMPGNAARLIRGEEQHSARDVVLVQAELQALLGEELALELGRDP